MGDPREPTDPLHPAGARRRRCATRMGYPARGRAARAARGDRRLAAAAASASTLDPDGEIVPTLGSKEAIFSFAQVVLDAAGGKDTVARHRARLSRLRARRAVRAAPSRRAAAARGARLPARPRRRRRRRRGRASRVLWVNYPNNPTGAVAPALVLRASWRRARASTTSCSPPTRRTRELWFDEPPVSALQLADRTNVVVFNTLSKRSSMTGYRSGFVAGDAGADRGAAGSSGRRVGTAPQEFVQRASVVAWGDEEHVERARARLPAQARRCSSAVLEAQGRPGRRQRGDDVPLGRGARRRDVGGVRRRGCSSTAIVVAPGSFFGAAGEGYVRLALVPTEEECARAAEILEGGAVTEREETIAALDRGERPRRREARRRVGRERGGQEGDPRLLPACARWSRSRSGPFEYHDKIPLKRGYAAAACASCRRRSPATARSSRAGVVADAELRQHRRLGRPAHDGRHVGDRRLVRADRRRRPPRRRRRHRRRARAAERAAGDRRGRRVHRLARDRRRGRPRRRGRRDRAERRR